MKVVPYESLGLIELDYDTFMNREDRVGGLSSSAPTHIYGTVCLSGLSDRIIFGENALKYIKHGEAPAVDTFVPNLNVYILLKAIDHAMFQVVVKISKNVAYIFATQLFYWWWKNGTHPERIPFLNSDGSFWMQSASYYRLAQKIYFRMYMSLDEFALVLFNGRLTEEGTEIKISQPFMPNIFLREDKRILVVEEDAFKYTITIENDTVSSSVEINDPERARLSDKSLVPVFRNRSMVELNSFTPISITGISEEIKSLMECDTQIMWDSENKYYRDCA